MSAWAGIDVAKDTLAVAVRPGGEGWTVANTPAAHEALCERLRVLGVERVVLEATGGYERAVLQALATSGLSAVRVDPRRARSFAVVVGRVAKTDPIDAAVLAHLAQVIEDPGVKAAPPAQQALRALVHRREQLVQQRDDERRRLKQASIALVRRSLERCIRGLQREIAALDVAMEAAAVEADAARAAQLRQVSGIGAVTTASLMAYVPELGALDRKQVAALVGVAPFNRDSGQASGPRRIRGGRAAIRRVLYMATLSVIRTQPHFKARYQALRARGKLAKVAIVACLRVLLIRLNAMVRDQTSWRVG